MVLGCPLPVSGPRAPAMSGCYVLDCRDEMLLYSGRIPPNVGAESPLLHRRYKAVRQSAYVFCPLVFVCVCEANDLGG